MLADTCLKTHEDVGFRQTTEKLAPYRELFFDGPLDETSLNGLVECYRSWRDERSYLCFHDPNKDKFRFVLSPKRGNYAYRVLTQQRVEPRLSWLDNENVKNISVRQQGHGKITNALFITLTVDPSKILGNRKVAWEYVQSHYNAFITAFRKAYGKTYAMKVFESQKNGFPHVHLFIMTKREWAVKLHSGKNGLSYRLKSRREKDGVAKKWSMGFVDVEAVASRGGEGSEGGESPIKNYIFKDLLKSVARSDPDHRDELTLALNWLFRKQSYSISGEPLLEQILDTVLPDLIADIHNSNSNSPEEGEFVYLGLITASFFHLNGLDPPLSFSMLGETCRKSGIDLAFPQFAEEPEA